MGRRTPDDKREEGAGHDLPTKETGATDGTSHGTDLIAEKVQTTGGADGLSLRVGPATQHMDRGKGLSRRSRE